MPGPPRKPTALRLVHGTRDKRNNKREPMPAGVPDAPAWLTAAAVAEWQRLRPELERIGLLTLVDQGTLAVYCQAVAELAESETMLEENGRTITNESTGLVRRSPWCAIRDEAWKRMNQAGQQFGLSPSARTRISVEPPPANSDKSQYLGF